MNGVAGADVYCEHFSHYLSLGTTKFSFDGAVEAIKGDLTHLNFRPPLFNQDGRKKNRGETTSFISPIDQEASAVFRLNTGHDRLYAHLCRFWIVDSPACPLCSKGAAMNTDNLLDGSALTKNCIYSQYWEARDSLNNLSFRFYTHRMFYFFFCSGV
ncbi:hypothetical protein NPIL_284901 [Nephila pilipes]|uniref:Uncharacterized protein n=1 Tax=Nephila pilipes TaxID=299642 RepID=A0A8X6INA8_NEPPI|nr:hypothetical protein NPIL_284901 [Nephila pilipes]